jgi:predicted enzyme related to lactoylglutathione lyase
VAVELWSRERVVSATASLLKGDRLIPACAQTSDQLWSASMPSPTIALVEFPADDVERAQRFWRGVLRVALEHRSADQGQGWQTHSEGNTALGLHARGAGPGDRVSLPYFAVADMQVSLQQVTDLGGSVIHPGEGMSICRDSEGSPFGLIQVLT